MTGPYCPGIQFKEMRLSGICSFENKFKKNVMTPHNWDCDVIYGAYFPFAVRRPHRNRNGTPSTSVLSYTATLTTSLPAPRIYSFVLPITNPITHAGSCHWRRWSFFNHIKPFSSFKCLFRIAQKLRRLPGRTAERPSRQPTKGPFPTPAIVPARFAVSMYPRSKAVPCRLCMRRPVIDVSFFVFFSCTHRVDL